MADKNSKLSENVAGAWYVDSTCTPCRTCMEVAGADALLKYNDGETYVYFHKQPSGDDEVKVAEETAAVCPQNAIGNDGE
jgi:ferredoxin